MLLPWKGGMSSYPQLVDVTLHQLVVGFLNKFRYNDVKISTTTIVNASTMERWHRSRRTKLPICSKLKCVLAYAVAPHIVIIF